MVLLLPLLWRFCCWSRQGEAELAACRDHDVFNALDIFENASFLKPLKFGEGDGNLRYYLYNWRVVKDLNPSEVGLVLL